jgi:hypothetical protein
MLSHCGFRFAPLEGISEGSCSPFLISTWTIACPILNETWVEEQLKSFCERCMSNTSQDEEKSTIILSSNFSYDLFAKYMREQGWTIRLREKQSEIPDRSLEEVWGKDGVFAAVHYMDNPRLWTRYLWIHGRNIWLIVEDLVSGFGGPTEAELYDVLAEVQTRGDLIVGLVRLAIAWADAFDSDVMEVFKYYARHEDSRVRSAVIQGLLFTKWPQGLPTLKDLADNDEAADVRDFAQKVFERVTEAQSETA